MLAALATGCAAPRGAAGVAVSGSVAAAVNTRAPIASAPARDFERVMTASSGRVILRIIQDGGSADGRATIAGGRPSGAAWRHQGSGNSNNYGGHSRNCS